MKVKSFLRALSAFLVIALIFSAIPLVGIAVKSFATTEPDTPLQSAALNQLSVLGSDAEKKDAATVQNIKFYHTLDLASDISVTFAIAKTSLANYDSFYLECTLPVYSGNTLVGTKAVKVEPIVKGGYYYFTVTGITAVNMNDTIEAVLHMTKGGVEYISQTDSYSVAAYAYTALSQNTDSKMLALCANLLRYGAEAQSYKKYRTDALVDAEMTDVHRSYLWDTSTLTFTTTDKKLGDLANPTITWVGKTLGLDSKVGVKYVFNTKNYTGNLADLSMKISYLDSKGVAQTVTLTGAQAYGSTGTQYSFTFYGLLASELRTVLDAAVFQGETQLSETLRYSAETYAYNTRGNVLEPLCRALFAYSDSALIFFGGTLPVPSYTVTFKDWDGTVLKTETVASGQSATAPADPTREGYTFIGWSGSYTNVTANCTVTATYTQNPASTEKYTVTFYDYDGTTVLATVTDVPSGGYAEPPADPTKDGSTFLGWSGSFANVTENTSVRAVYSDEKNILMVSSASGSVGDTVTVMISVDGNVKTCAFDIDIMYDSNLELVSYDADMDLDVVVNTEAYENGIKMNFCSVSDKTKQRDALELTFRIKDTTKKALPIVISMNSIKEIINNNPANTTYSTVCGMVFVK